MSGGHCICDSGELRVRIPAASAFFVSESLGSSIRAVSRLRSNAVIIGLVLQQSLALGLLGYLVALAVGSLTYDNWPRLVVVQTADKLLLLGIVVGICVVANPIGIRRALRVEEGAALSG